MYRKKTVRVCATLVSVVALAAPFGGAATAAPSVPWLSGSILSPGGSPDAGAEIAVFARPLDATISALPDGALVPDVYLGETATDSNGAFQMTFPGTSLAAEELSDGTVNFLMDAFDGAGNMTTYTFNDSAAPSATIAVPDLTVLDTTPADLPDPDPIINEPALIPCKEQKTQDYGSTSSIVGGTNSEMNHQTASFTYSAGAMSSLGTAVSASGDFGSFTESGNSSHSSGSTQGFASNTGADFTHYKSYFDYQEFLEVCGGGNTGAPRKTYDHTAEAGAWDGGGAEGQNNPDPRATYCVPEGKGSTWVSGSQSATTFTAGVDLSIIGISVESQTGYSTAAQASYGFTDAGQICGTDNYAGRTAPGALEAESS